ncbi:MAG TPA: hypothetical protein DD979_00440 [Gammaproteobacteria bacterium]|jgi:hypothetical protein|nr:hypothetical protein [Gammaproteobacteria bacterium]
MADLISGIFAPPGDLHADALHHVAERLQPGACARLAFPQAGVPAVSLERDAVYWGGEDVSRLQRAFVRGFSYTNPVVPRAMDDVDWSLWQYDYIGEQQKTSFLYSALSELDRRGVRMSNAPRVYLDVSMKTDLLARVRASGIQVPDVMCTNTRDEADAFMARHEHVLWRPATGRAAWQLCRERQLEFLVGADKTPVLLSSIAPGMFLRCYLVDGEPVLCLKYAAPEQVPLERLEVFQAIEDDSFYTQLRDTAAVLGMRWGAVHCVFDAEAGFAVYDIDPDPVVSAMPAAVQEYLNLCIAHDLLGQSIPASDALRDTALVRELPFLRRMLSVLFDMERSKYAPQPPVGQTAGE